MHTTAFLVYGNPTKAKEGKTPKEAAWTGKKTNIAQIKVFDST